MKTAQHFDAMSSWKSVMMLPLEERKAAFRNPEIRAKLHKEAVDTPPDPNLAGDFTRRWDLQFVHQPALAKHAGLIGQPVQQSFEARRIIPDWNDNRDHSPSLEHACVCGPALVHPNLYVSNNLHRGVLLQVVAVFGSVR